MYNISIGVRAALIPGLLTKQLNITTIHTSPLSHNHMHVCCCSTDPPVLSDAGEVKLRENEELKLNMADSDSSPAYPIPSQVSWTKDGEEIDSALPTRVFNYSSIFIGSVEPSDSGVYQLSVTSYFLNGSLFQSDSASLTLNVLCESVYINSIVCATYIHDSVCVVRCGGLLTFDGSFELNLVVSAFFNASSH